MRFSVTLLLAASAGLVAAQTDPAGQCIQTCFARVGQDNPDSPDIARCQALTDGLQQLLCLCRSSTLVDAFTTCTGETCPEFAEQVNGTAICQNSEIGALDPSGSGDAAPSDTANGVDAGPSNTAGGVDAGPASDTGSGASATNTANGAGPSKTASDVGASNTDSGAPAGGTQAPAPTSGGTDAGNGVRSHRVTTLNFVLGGAAVALAVSLVI